jgi:hypothetical protein
MTDQYGICSSEVKVFFAGTLKRKVVKMKDNFLTLRNGVFFTVRVYNAGASAVVGVDLDYVELSSHKSMVMLVASGTAVVIED